MQVEYLAKRGTLNPKDIKIPGAIVDYVVVAQDKASCWQTEGTYYEPAFSGQIKKPLSSIRPLPFDERKVICRRCAMELRKGDIINFGVGMASDTASVVSEEGYIDDVVMSTESGMVGGVPASMPNFGTAYNAEAVIDHGYMFDLINGGGLDVTCLGIGEIDRFGNNNVSKFGPRLTGPGGFIDITVASPKIIFCGSFMGKAKLKVGEGKLEILQEGTIKKFVPKVEQITFAGAYADKDQTVLYVTERAVFMLIGGKVTLVEIAPGIDLERDILAHMGFIPEISDDLKTMNEENFHENWGGLGKYIMQ